jgi:hypothetical protein
MGRRETKYDTSLDLLKTPNLRTSTLKALEYLKFNGEAYDSLLLDFPEELEYNVVKFTYNKISYEGLIEEIEKNKIIPEPISSWEYTAKPILEVLPWLKVKFPGLEIQYYGRKEIETSNMDISLTLANLTLRTIITGKVDCNLWKETISKSHQVNAKELDIKTEIILKKAGTNSVCLADIGQSKLLKRLHERGVFVRSIYIEKPYHFTPLSILDRRMSLAPMNDCELEKLVFYHVEYIRNYIYRFSNRDRAHYEWILNKIKWPKLSIDIREVKLLDNLKPTQNSLSARALWQIYYL